MAQFKVIVAGVNRVVDGYPVFHKAGSLIDLAEHEAARLLKLKAVAPVDADGVVTAMPEPDPVSPHLEPDIEDPSAFAVAAAGKHAAPEPDPEPVVPPRGNASLEEWQTFAKANGATDADLEGKTQRQIRDMFGPAGKDDPS